jgi:Family of unknown function (DUF6174)
MRILLLLMLVVACSSPSLTLEGRTLWTSKNLSSYGYTLKRSCFCGEDVTRPMRLEVRNGKLGSAVYIDSGVNVPEQFRPGTFKIEAFFDLIDATRNNGGTVDGLHFDATFGYPTQMNLNPILNATDGEISYMISDLGALTSSTLEGRTLWASKNLSNYGYTLERSCFCPTEITKPMRLEVRNGGLSGIKYLDSGADVPTNFRPATFNIDAFFDLIDATQNRGGRVENLKFDPTFGYPTQMNLDPIPSAVDDETAYKLTDLRAL